jgi:hypothetical protein
MSLWISERLMNAPKNFFLDEGSRAAKSRSIQLTSILAIGPKADYKFWTAPESKGKFSSPLSTNRP